MPVLMHACCAMHGGMLPILLLEERESNLRYGCRYCRCTRPLPVSGSETAKLYILGTASFCSVAASAGRWHAGKRRQRSSPTKIPPCKTGHHDGKACQAESCHEGGVVHWLAAATDCSVAQNSSLSATAHALAAAAVADDSTRARFYGLMRNAPRREATTYLQASGEIHFALTCPAAVPTIPEKTASPRRISVTRGCIASVRQLLGYCYRYRCLKLCYYGSLADKFKMCLSHCMWS
ncbi:hypothetical protein V8C86DRAFT_2632097 [Haematococcus lacustris]